jgi:hypothetical protein
MKIKHYTFKIFTIGLVGSVTNECDVKINLSTGEIIHQVEKIDNLEDSKKQIEEIFASEVLKNVKKGWEKV